MAEEYNSKYTEILEKLKGNYLFKLSLGSKELFHSNFLEMLWELDNGLFIQMIRKLTNNEDLLLRNQEDYHLSREKENFDICIYHDINASRGDNKKPIYDLIIENKVKSIPHQTQLIAYEKKIQEANHCTNNKRGKNKEEWKAPCSCILLSLVDTFSEKKLISERNWKIVNYNDLLGAITQVYNEDAIIKSVKQKNEADEYCNILGKYKEFIEQLHELQKLICTDFKEKPLFDTKIISEFQRYRLHDLYIKQSCGLFVDLLKEQLNLSSENYKFKIDLWSKYNSKKARENNENKILILLHEEMLQGVGSVGVTICPTWSNADVNKDFYEIIIQNGQYRHCINRAGTSKTKTVPDLWKEVMENENAFISNPKSVQGCKEWYKGTSDYCTYRDKNNSDLYVYKYVKIDTQLHKSDGTKYSASELAKIMVSDILTVVAKFK